MPAHQGVGSLTLEITPIDSIRLSYSCTRWRSGMGTFLGVYSEYGVASSFSFILYGSPNVPRPLKSFGNNFRKSCSPVGTSECAASTRQRR